ncbi:MAG TPA: AraC family transcriptional regulator [Luteitalea sp.]|nr:AraC family transcriptional regulator [Luteitalea sp.]
MLDRPRDTTPPWPTTTDPLGEALHFLRMSGTFYARSEFTAPWGLAIPPFPDSVVFHVVTEGACWVELPDADRQHLQTGDLALLPHGQGHALASQPGAPLAELFSLPRVEVSDRYERLQYGGGGAPTSVICAVVRFDHPAARQLLSVLPRVLRVEERRSPQFEWLQSTLRLMADEARQLRPGGETVLTRLADILIIQTIRTWIERDPAAQTGWLAALRDPQIGRALALFHRDPAREWTVAALAAAAAMSRSAFAARFTELVGEPAMQYATRWRMHVALSRLKDGDTSLGELADGVGYQSEAAFSRAFKRVVGMSPGAARTAGVAR